MFEHKSLHADIVIFTENDFGRADVNITQVGTFKKAPYKYSLTPLKSVESVVKKNAGLGKVKV